MSGDQKYASRFKNSFFQKLSPSNVYNRYQNIPSLHDDEHVVHSEAEEKEGDEVVQRTEAEAESAAEAVRGHHGKHHREQAHDGQIDL